MTVRCTLYNYECPKNFREFHGYTYPEILMVFLPIDAVNMRTKFEDRSFTCSWDNKGTPKICEQSLNTPTLSFLQNL